MEPFVALVKSRVGVWGVEGTDDSISNVYLPNEKRRASRGAPPRAVGSCVAQLEEYFRGARRTFDVTLAEHPSTPFQREVWAALAAIPYGQVRTYGDVARATNRPRAMRAVGNANHANPWPILIACHRVVGAHGLGGYGGGDQVKRYLLGLEGVRYD